MTHRLPRKLIAGALSLGLGLLLAWSGQWYAGHRDQATRLAEELAASRRLAASIEQLRQRPELVQTTLLEEPQLARRIEEAARDAGVRSADLERINPEPPQRLGNTVYEEAPTHVVLRGVTLRQFGRFLDRLSEQGAGLNVKALRLIAPRGEEQSDRWKAEATVTYLIYSPRGPRNTRSPRAPRTPRHAGSPATSGQEGGS